VSDDTGGAVEPIWPAADDTVAPVELTAFPTAATAAAAGSPPVDGAGAGAGAPAPDPVPDGSDVETTSTVVAGAADPTA
jgi:hypothetical protein